MPFVRPRFAPKRPDRPGKTALIRCNPGWHDRLSLDTIYLSDMAATGVGGPMSSGLQPPTGDWTRIPIGCVEDLSDAVYGAGLDATQMSRAPVTGSLAFAFDGDVTYSTGKLGGQVAIAGPLSQDMVTLGLGLVLAPGSRQWLNDVTTGNLGIFLPGVPHDALYMPGSLYATATLTFDRLEEFAARRDIVLDARTLGDSGVDPQKVPKQTMDRLRAGFMQVHEGPTGRSAMSALGDDLLEALVVHLGRIPRPPAGLRDPRGYALVVARARTFIHEHLDQSLSIDRIAAAASTSHRTLHRAFQTVLNETPYSYVLKLRLHRIRHELVSDRELARSITAVAHRWGIHELGRFAGLYRDLFGELPSTTLKKHSGSRTPA
jgi:AraC-like DNA-binding protein